MKKRVGKIKLKNNICTNCRKELDGIESGVSHYIPKKPIRTSTSNKKNLLCNECNKKVIDALSEKQWDYRTASSIAKEVNLETNLVNSILTNNKKVRVSIAPSASGEKLFTLKSKISTFSDFWNSLKRLSSDKY